MKSAVLDLANAVGAYKGGEYGDDAAERKYIAGVAQAKARLLEVCQPSEEDYDRYRKNHPDLKDASPSPTPTG
ncbi:hypothetical protein HII36_52170 [Nonomuraea sp. NN258]|uniref:hypothetical protein n=1 Tax=Nonomuraea antri TaxID=2730852 RepID=UPI0015698472|nr:hypothetical protein [Nonomuraea antri]NRQ40326.1 hypothetical protein [Nonomuraea antri]